MAFTSQWVQDASCPGGGYYNGSDGLIYPSGWNGAGFSDAASAKAALAGQTRPTADWSGTQTWNGTSWVTDSTAASKTKIGRAHV